ncbi:unnamed protein product [Medioppia subpectinata]|uniref:Uncharacterized protein n=1 Tax=Medioppia subpectinata TaxID=1979941 RepID=A0A7R9KNL8_9ACAR|nr:unnamed protein product [Medioppia subpectinata]CAG2106590.1 unnamed protein product [Medioppia subpectinata]
MVIVLGTAMVTVLAQTRQTPAQCRSLCSRVRCASGPERQLVSGATKTKAECKRMCMAVRCAPADPSQCAAISNSVYLDYAPELCRCCSVCQVNLSVGQNCAPELRLSKKCNPGLTCDAKSNLCVKQ